MCIEFPVVLLFSNCGQSGQKIPPPGSSKSKSFNLKKEEERSQMHQTNDLAMIFNILCAVISGF